MGRCQGGPREILRLRRSDTGIAALEFFEPEQSPQQTLYADQDGRQGNDRAGGSPSAVYSPRGRRE